MSLSPVTPASHDAQTQASSASRPIVEVDGQLEETPQPPQKRKGGRKPIYATSEERKQRNRQAQAAFRERRTEYIKQLEIQMKQDEDTIEALQKSQQSAADECHQLRHRNAMLERIIAEKGFDIQAELQARNSSPIPRPQPASPDAPIVQQAIMNRHQRARRPPSFATPKLEQQTDTSSVQALHVAPTTPLSSRYSSPALTQAGSPIMDVQSRAHLSQTHGQSYPQNQQVLAAQYNYSSYSSLHQHQTPVQTHGQHATPNDFAYSQGGIAGYHTPQSLDDNQPSRHSSLAQSAVSSLDPASEPQTHTQFQPVSSYRNDQYAAGPNFYGNDTPGQNMPQQPVLYPAQQFVGQHQGNFLQMHNSGIYAQHLYGQDSQGMNTINRQSEEEIFNLSASMRYPNNYAFEVDPMR